MLAIGWFLVLVAVGQAARYLRWREDSERSAPPSAPVPGRVEVDAPGRVALTLAAAMPLAVAPMMMLRPPGEVSVWLGGASFVWAGVWIAAGMAQVIRDERRVIDLTTPTEVIDLRIAEGFGVVDTGEDRARVR